MFAFSNRFSSLAVIGAVLFVLAGCGKGDDPAPGSNESNGNSTNGNATNGNATNGNSNSTNGNATNGNATNGNSNSTNGNASEANNGGLPPGNETVTGQVAAPGGDCSDRPCGDGYECVSSTDAQGTTEKSCLAKAGTACANTECAGAKAVCQVPISAEDTYARTGSAICCIPHGEQAEKKEHCCEAALVEDFEEGQAGTCTLKKEHKDKDEFKENTIPCGYAGNECCIEEKAANPAVLHCAGTSEQSLTCAQSSGTSASTDGNTGTTCRKCGEHNQYACTAAGGGSTCSGDLVVKTVEGGFSVCCNSAQEDGCDGSESLDGGTSTASEPEGEGVSELAETCATHTDCESCINAIFPCGFCNGECVPVDANTRKVLDSSSANASEAAGTEEETTSTDGALPTEASSSETATKSVSTNACVYNPNNPRTGLVLHAMSCPNVSAPSANSGTTTPSSSDQVSDSTDNETDSQEDTGPEDWTSLPPESSD